MRPGTRIAAFFDQPDKVDAMVYEVGMLGVPRDLVEVIVSPATAAAKYGPRARKLGKRVFTYAGGGALIGLLAGTALSLVIILLPGFELPEWAALIQLLGPNAGSILGAIAGAAAGATLRQPPVDVYRLALERDAILLLVHPVAADLAERVFALLRENSDDVRLIPTTTG